MKTRRITQLKKKLAARLEEIDDCPLWPSCLKTVFRAPIIEEAKRECEKEVWEYQGWHGGRNKLVEENGLRSDSYEER
jgi:hypothetical protein